IIATILIISWMISMYITIRQETVFYQDIEKYISTLSHRIKRVGEEALLEMPIGIVLFDENYHIEWSNPYMNQFSDLDTLVGETLSSLSEELIARIEQEESEAWIELSGYMFRVDIRHTDRLLYLFDRTSEHHIKELYDDEQTVLAIIYLDNYEEITRNLDDSVKSQLNSEVTSVLNEWAMHHGLYLKRTSQDRFLAVGTTRALLELEK